MCIKFTRVQLRFKFLADCKRKPGDFETATHTRLDESSLCA